MATESMDVIVVGSCNVDLISYVERFPKAGETLCGKKFVMGCGGKGANQCIMSAKLGAKTAMIGCIGDDVFGEMFVKTFTVAGVDIQSLKTVSSATTGVATITVNEEGENNIVITKGANNCISPDQLKASVDVIVNAKVALFQLEVDFAATLFALKLAYENGVTTIFNPAPALKDLPSECLTYSSILCCNETEIIFAHFGICSTYKHLFGYPKNFKPIGVRFIKVAVSIPAAAASTTSNLIAGLAALVNFFSQGYYKNLYVPHYKAEILTGVSVDLQSATNCELAVRMLLKKGPSIVVLTLGSKGAIFGEKESDTVYHILPPVSMVKKVVDTTGAGDCFVGSLAYFLARRKDLNFYEVIRRSVAIASISVTRHGTQTSYPDLNELSGDLVN